MQTNSQPPGTSKGIIWLGYVLSALPVLLLIFSAVIKLMKPPQVVEGFAHFGIPESLIFKLGILCFGGDPAFRFLHGRLELAGIDGLEQIIYRSEFNCLNTILIMRGNEN